RNSYIEFRDLETDNSISVVTDAAALQGFEPPLAAGSKIVFLAEVEFWQNKGSIQVRARQIQRLGVGNLIAALEELRRKLQAEGLFDPSRKKPLPFLPRKVGLITGRDTDAMKDFVRNARRRWPHTEFVLKEIALQTRETPLLAIRALDELQAHPEVDVIVIARGGGSLEDLLPWNDEGLLRAVVASVKPVVSAIGHEADRPLLDDAADVRASTPTDAAAKIVPSLEEEIAILTNLRAKISNGRNAWLNNEQRHLAAARSTLSAKSPRAVVRLWQMEIGQARIALRSKTKQRIQQHRSRLELQTGRLAALSPYAILGRGYALATNSSGEVIKSPSDLPIGADFKLRLAESSITATRIEDKDK
ncbi:MAG: hypothetical protein RL038_1265, partial [Actinomycetota bacterium]